MSSKVSATDLNVSTLSSYFKNYTTATWIKRTNGDSVNNHRTPSVNQCINYLKNVGRANVSSYSNSVLSMRVAVLEESYKFFLEKGLFKSLRKKLSRTDAYDINEYFRVYNKYVRDNSVLKGILTKRINTRLSKI